MKIITFYLVEKCQIWLDLAEIIIYVSYSVDIKLISGEGYGVDCYNVYTIKAT